MAAAPRINCRQEPRQPPARPILTLTRQDYFAIAERTYQLSKTAGRPPPRRHRPWQKVRHS